MLKILFLILIIACSTVFVQSQKEAEAYKFFEYVKISDVLLREKFTEFMKVLETKPESQGYVISYGTRKDVASREKQILRFNYRCNIDCPRLTFVNGRNKEKPKTVFWIVPPSAKIPQP